MAAVAKDDEHNETCGGTNSYKTAEGQVVVMGLTSPTADGPPVPLFDAIIPIVSGQQNGSATITYWTDNKAAAELIRKKCRSVAGWFYGYWIHVQHYKLGMVKKLMESFDIDAALLA